MNFDSRIYVAGHRGLVGSAVVRLLSARGYKHIITRTRQELDLTVEFFCSSLFLFFFFCFCLSFCSLLSSVFQNYVACEGFFAAEKPEFVFLCAAKVGGILANDTKPADFLLENLEMQSILVKMSHKFVCLFVCLFFFV